MKKVVLEQYIKENKAVFTKTALRMDKGRNPIGRKRDEEEKSILLKLDKARWEKWIKMGKIEVLGDRKYKVKF